MVSKTIKKLDHTNVVFPVVGFLLYTHEGLIISIDNNKNKKRLQKKKY
jgi:hypothetical protein